MLFRFFYTVKADVAALLEGRRFVPRFVAGRQPFAHGGQTAEVRAEGSIIRESWKTFRRWRMSSDMRFIR